MEPKITPSGTFEEPEQIDIIDGNYVLIGHIGQKWMYGYKIDCAPLRQIIECSILNELFESHDNALQAALIQMQHQAQFADVSAQFLPEAGRTFKKGNPSISLTEFLLSIEDLQRKLVLKVLEDIFP